MNQSSPLRPVRIRKDGDQGLIIDWSDGQTGSVSWRTLRDQCPCAGCQEERAKPPNPFRVLKPSEIPTEPLRPLAMTPVGYYAYKIAWNDGHDTGIFTFDTLRALCQLSGPPASESHA
jgi:DUF971 family protein